MKNQEISQPIIKAQEGILDSLKDKSIQTKPKGRIKVKSPGISANVKKKTSKVTSGKAIVKSNNKAPKVTQEIEQPLSLLPPAGNVTNWSDNEVEKWLQSNPEFFWSRQELANQLLPPGLVNAKIELSGDKKARDDSNDKLVSLEGWTQEKLFSRIEQLSFERSGFIKIARANEAITRSMVDIALAITSSETLEEVLETFAKGFKKHYKVEARLIDVNSFAAVSKWAKSLLQTTDVYYSEHVTAELVTELRGLLSITVGSFVLARVKQAPRWIAVFASDDAQKYGRDVERDSLFLESLLLFVGARLKRAE